MNSRQNYYFHGVESPEFPPYLKCKDNVSLEQLFFYYHLLLWGTDTRGMLPWTTLTLSSQVSVVIYTTYSIFYYTVIQEVSEDSWMPTSRMVITFKMGFLLLLDKPKKRQLNSEHVYHTYAPCIFCPCKFWNMIMFFLLVFIIRVGIWHYSFCSFRFSPMWIIWKRMSWNVSLLTIGRGRVNFQAKKKIIIYICYIIAKGNWKIRKKVTYIKAEIIHRMFTQSEIIICNNIPDYVHDLNLLY